MKYIFATNNIHKVSELQASLSSCNIELLSLKDYPDIPDIEETGSTFLENALIKAKTIYKLFKIPVIADDSGLEIEYLDNKPGIYSKRYAGINAADRDRIRKVLSELKNVPLKQRRARFVCSMIIINKKKSFQTTGFCNGYIAEKPAGTNGFGYDPIFFLPDLNKTMAQLSPLEKNIISHRANAVKKIKNILINLN